MSKSEFEPRSEHEFANPGARAAPGLALFLDRPHLRDQLAEDARALGFAVLCAAPVDALCDSGVPPGAAVILVDCPVPSVRSLAALAVQDLAARNTGARLIVATTLAGLDDVFACLDQSQPQLLVDPSAADLAIALGHAFMQAATLRLRELADDDRRRLIQLTEMVVRLVERFDRFEPAPATAGAPSPGRLSDPAISFHGAPDQSGHLIQPGQPGLPPPVLVRQILRHRQQRASYFGPGPVRRPRLGHVAGPDRRAGRRQARVGDLAMYRRRRPGDHGAALDRADDRSRAVRAPRRSVRPPPRLHRPQRPGGQRHGGLLRHVGG